VRTIQRVLIVHPGLTRGPEFSVQDVYAGWAEALTALGLQVTTYNLNDRIVFYSMACMATGNKDDQGRMEFKRALPGKEEAITMAACGVMGTCFQEWPDLVLVIMGKMMPAQYLGIIRDRGIKVALLHTESPYEDSEQLNRAAYVNLNLLNDPCNLDAYRALGVPAHYMPHAYRRGLHFAGVGDDELASDFAFVGTGFPSRIEFFERMWRAGGMDRIDVALCGNWCGLAKDSPLRPLVSHDINSCVDNDLAARIYRAGKTGINIYRREAEDEHRGEGWALGPREVEMAACGLFYLREHRGESDEVFPMLPVHHGPEDAVQQLRWWLDHDAQREKVARAARAAIRDRTFDANARRLMELVEKL
jgi:spore maturation protein CgeB